MGMEKRSTFQVEIWTCGSSAPRLLETILCTARGNSLRF
jgi:hypothetical protein